MMTKWQQSYLVESVEEGVKLVRDSGRIAVIAGRETLFFDIQRFGLSSYFKKNILRRFHAYFRSK